MEHVDATRGSWWGVGWTGTDSSLGSWPGWCMGKASCGRGLEKHSQSSLPHRIGSVHREGGHMEGSCLHRPAVPRSSALTWDVTNASGFVAALNIFCGAIVSQRVTRQGRISKAATGWSQKGAQQVRERWLPFHTKQCSNEARTLLKNRL